MSFAAVAISAVGVGTQVYGAYQASEAGEENAKVAEENARLAEEMGEYNAGIAEGKARQAIDNAIYDAGFAELELMADLFVLDYQANVKKNQAKYEEDMATLIAEDGAINQVRKRKQDLKNLATIEVEAAAAGAVNSGTVLEVLSESVKNMEIDALEIGRLAGVEQNKRMQNAYSLNAEAELLQGRSEMREIFGDMQQESIKREGELLSQDYKDEAQRLKKYSKIDASNYLASASQYRAQGRAAAWSSVSNAASTAANTVFSYNQVS